MSKEIFNINSFEYFGYVFRYDFELCVLECFWDGKMVDSVPFDNETWMDPVERELMVHWWIEQYEDGISGVSSLSRVMEGVKGCAN